MPAKSKKSDLEPLYTSVLELIAKSKAQLKLIPAGGENVDFELVFENLRRLASSAEKFTASRFKSEFSKTLGEYTDTLDSEGVNLWNLTGTFRTSNDAGKMSTLIPSLRLAAFRLVEAGLENNPSVETLINVLQMASKTGIALANIGAHDIAGSVLTSAAKFEDILRNTDDPQNSHRTDKAVAFSMYFCSRMEAAWKEENLSLAEYMAQRITGDDKISLLSPNHRELIASKFLEIGRSVLHTQTDQKESAKSAITWLQMAMSAIDQVDDENPSSIVDLKISVLRTLARAFFFSEAYDRAEATLDELIPCIDRSLDNSSHEFQELRWLRLAVVKRRKSGDTAVLEALDNIVQHMELTECNVLEVLQDMRSTLYDRKHVTSVHESILSRAISRDNPSIKIIDTILLSLIVHCSKDDNHQAAMQTIQDVFKSIVDANCQLQRTPAAACITLIWRYGTTCFGQKNFMKAADWFLLGTHSLLDIGSSTSKCYRKAALCYIEEKEFAKASLTMKKCSNPDEAANCYVLFLSAIQQGLEEEAIHAITSMVKAKDFDRKMLLLATQISHESSMRPVLLKVLQSLLASVKDDMEDGVVEALALVRCIVRLALKLLDDPAVNRDTVIATIIDHSAIGLRYSKLAVKRNSISLISKDIQWLWRTTYNLTVAHCSSNEDSTEAILKARRLFEVSRDLIDCCLNATVGDGDQELYVHWINCAFSAVAGQVFELRQLPSISPEAESQSTQILGEIGSTTHRIENIISKTLLDEHAARRAEYFIHVLRVFEAELRAHRKDWNELLMIVQNVVSGGTMAVDTYESIADILWEEQDCPVNVLHTCLEAILHASLDHSILSVTKFSRWLRAICTISLARNTLDDRVKAIGYVEQAVDVMKSNEEYPSDERVWILSTAYNTGYECLKSSALDEAKRWFEVSTRVCKYVLNGESYAEKISEAYSQALELHSRNQRTARFGD